MRRETILCDRCQREAPLLLDILVDGKALDICPGCAVAMISDFPRSEAREMLVRKPGQTAEVIRYAARRGGRHVATAEG